MTQKPPEAPNKPTDLNQLSPQEMRARLAKLLERKGQKQVYPLSSAQRRLWFLDRLVPNSPFYNVPLATRIRGALDRPALCAALSDILRRHQTLRTRIDVVADEPVQVVDAPTPVDLREHDLGALPEDERERALRRLARAEALAPFDLRTGPLWRTTLIRLADDHHALLITIHHICSDGWSLEVLGRELAALYGAHAAGRPAELASLPLQYHEYAARERRELAGPAMQEHLAYWRAHLDGIQPLALCTDHARPAVPSFRGAVVRFSLGLALTRKLEQLAKDCSATLFMTLLAGFQVLLHRYTGQRDIAVGTPVANRDRRDIEGLIGFFVNSLVLRTSLADDVSFIELLDRVKRTTLDAYAHQALPFELLVERLAPDRDMSRNPLFQVVFALQQADIDTLSLPGLATERLSLDSQVTRFDLEVHLGRTDSGLQGIAIHAVDLFETGTIERLLAHYRQLLEAIVADPRARISTLRILSADERRALLDMGAGMQAQPQIAIDADARLPIPAQVARAAARAPHALAVAMGDQRMDYRTLAARAATMARALHERGVGAEHVVAVWMRPGPDVVAVFLGILAAGAAYLPLDASTPPQRLAQLLSDAGAVLLVSDRAPADCPPDLHAPVMPASLIHADLTHAGAPRAGQDVLDIAPACRDTGLAYLIYTSGSTGRPNAVAVTHGSLCNLVAWHRRAFSVRAGDRATQIASLAFDAAVWELWPYLSAGASIHIPTPDTRTDPARLRDWLVDEQIDVCFLPTPLAERVLSLTWPAGGRLRFLLTGGDRLTRRPPAGLGFRVINDYGPTEGTVVASSGPVTNQDDAATDELPSIGRPIDGAHIRLLDAHLRLVPPGVPGELYLGGAGLARGYLHRPGLSAQRFVPDPLIGEDPAARPGDRLYRTGDLARWLPDGSLQFLGRIDDQLKLRGYRVEPGEIEALLLEHEGVREACVVAQRVAEIDHRLVAYLVLDHDRALPADQVDELARARVDHWRTLYDHTYDQTPDTGEADFNITGWDSSYTGEAIPEQEMDEWRRSVVERILATAPRRVLEIGCGTGLLLFQVAPRCESYWATDFSRVSLDYIRGNLARAKDMPPVELLEREADDFHELTPGAFDTVVINSVIQYFPDEAYLRRVLAGALERVAAGGVIFVGDVRDMRLLSAQHASVALFRADDEVELDELDARVQRAIREDRELLVHPDFFVELARASGRRVEVEVRLKRGQYRHEMNCFRYDVLLHVEPADTRAQVADTLDWAGEDASGVDASGEDASGEDAPGVDARIGRLQQHLRARAPDSLLVRGVANARVAAAARTRDLLAERAGGDDALGGITALRQQSTAAEQAAVDPMAFWTLADEIGYEVEVFAGRDERTFDVIFRKRGSAAARQPWPQPPAQPGAGQAGEGARPRPAGALVSTPMGADISALLIPALRSRLEASLPEYMIPARIVPLDAMPLTRNGKIDRRALAARDAERLHSGRAYEPPRNEVEQRLAEIWIELLRLERVGRQDDFFDLGGHSLLATQLMSRVGDSFGVELPLRALFQDPTIAGLAAAIADEEGGGAAITAMPRDPAQPLPLSFAQQRLWFLDQYITGNPFYNVPGALRLAGALDVPALEATFTEIVRRHEPLRTRFPNVDGRPRQVIEPPGAHRIEHLDLRTLPAEQREQEALRLTVEEAQTPFDLGRGPLIRTRLIRIADDVHILVINMHHIVSDGWSIGVLVRELAALYGAYTSGRAPRLPDLPVQYADFACWQRSWLQGEVRERLLGYWRKQLADIPELELPKDHPAPEVQRYHGRTIAHMLPRALSEQVYQLSQAHGATLFMTLLAGFYVLLHRCTGRTDIAVGSPIANRNHSEIEGLIGFFVNSLVMRTDIGGNPTMEDILRRVRETTLDAYAHQDMPFEGLVEALAPERDPRRNPFFQVAFALQNTPMARLELGALTLTPVDFELGTTRFDLEYHVWERPEGLRCVAVFDTDLFEEETILSFHRLYESVLAAIVRNPRQRLLDLEVGPDGEGDHDAPAAAPAAAHDASEQFDF